MPSIAITITDNDWTRIKPAFRSAYGPIVDPNNLLTDDDLAVQALKHHVQNMVKDYERFQAEEAISISNLD